MFFDSLILDVDGTLWNTTGVVAEAWNEAVMECFPQIPPVSADILKNQFGKTMDVIADNLFPSLSAADKRALMKKCCQNEQLALLRNKAELAYEGVRSSIKNLSKKVPVFIVSNCQSGYIELVIKKIGISGCIRDFECFGNNKKTKDENLRLIIERNLLKKPVYVGDTDGDFQACRRAGLPFIWASYGFGHPASDDYFDRIDHFSDLEKFFMSF